MDKINQDILIERIESLCTEKKITPTTAYIESGVGKNFKSNLKTANPSLGKITMLANYFNVSVDYLIGKTEQKNPLITGSDERTAQIMNLIKDLDAESQAAVLVIVEQMRKQQKESQ